MAPKQSIPAISWQDGVLTLTGGLLPVDRLNITYLEAFCRAASHDRDWGETVIPHTTELLSASSDGTRLQLESRLSDGVIVSHLLTSGEGEVCFELAAHNPGNSRSEACWAQPCVQVGGFTGLDGTADRFEYINRCFIFIDGRLTRMPTPSWATVARYTPGQVWRPAHVPPADVNPRPLNPIVPSNGLIGCYSRDERLILATAWEPYQELFQGVLQCIHSDFRIGGLKPHETKMIRGRIYIVENDMNALLERYARDFPEHAPAKHAGTP